MLPHFLSSLPLKNPFSNTWLPLITEDKISESACFQPNQSFLAANI